MPFNGKLIREADPLRMLNLLKHQTAPARRELVTDKADPILSKVSPGLVETRPEDQAHGHAKATCSSRDQSRRERTGGADCT